MDDTSKDNSIFIVGQVASSKNSKIWTGSRLVKSKASQEYVNVTKPQWRSHKAKFLNLIRNKEFPIRIEFQLVRRDKRRFDYVNLVQLPLDIMVWEGWLPDDSANYVIPVFKEYEINKELPGIRIKVL